MDAAVVDPLDLDDDDGQRSPTTHKEVIEQDSPKVSDGSSDLDITDLKPEKTAFESPKAS